MVTLSNTIHALPAPASAAPSQSRLCCPNLARTPGGWLGDLCSIPDSSIRAWAIPFRAAGGLHWVGPDEEEADDAATGTDRTGPGRVRARHRAVPAGTAGPLLPDARLAGRGRGSGPGNVPAGLAVARRLRGPVVAAGLAVPDRHQRLPDRAGTAGPPRAAVRPGRAQRRPGRGARGRRARGTLARAHPGRAGHRAGHRSRGYRGGAREPAPRPDRLPAVPARPATGRAHPARRAGLPGRRG